MHLRNDPTPIAKSSIYRSGKFVIDLRRSNSILAGRAQAQAVQIADGLRFASLQEALNQMRTSTLPADVTAHFEQVLTERANQLLTQASDNLASEALALGRHDEMTVFANDIQEAVYTSLLDQNTCDPCAAADGTVVEFGSADYYRMMPPYSECDGLGRCRCQYVLTLRSESAGGAIPITPLAPTAPWAPLPRTVVPVPWERPILPPEPVAVPPRAVAVPPERAIVPPIEPLPATGTPKEYATAIRARAVATEPVVSRAAETIANDTGGTLVTKVNINGREVDIRLKTIDSIERKVALDAHTLTATEVEATVKDALRYTTLFRAENYATGVQDAVTRLKAQGFTLVRSTNYWPSDGYKGINTVWRAQNGQLFEMQFHTPTSLDVKERISHPLYDRRKAETDPLKRAEIDRAIERAWIDVPRPLGVLDLKF